MRKEIKRAYFWMSSKDSDYGWAVVAHNLKEAKLLGWNYNASEIGNDDEWTDIYCVWKKNIKVESLPYGVLELEVGLRAGIYGYCDDFKCDKCKERKLVYPENGAILCTDCIESSEEVLND